MAENNKIHQAVIVDEKTYFTLEEICLSCGERTEFIVELVEHGVLEPIEGEQPETWHFTIHELHRVRIAANLYHDLEVNYAGLTVALNLLEELEDLRTKVKLLKRRNKLFEE